MIEIEEKKNPPPPPKKTHKHRRPVQQSEPGLAVHVTRGLVYHLPGPHPASSEAALLTPAIRHSNIGKSDTECLPNAFYKSK